MAKRIKHRPIEITTRLHTGIVDHVCKNYMRSATRQTVVAIMLHEWYEDAVMDGKIPAVDFDKLKG